MMPDWLRTWCAPAGLPTVLEACSAGTLATANCASYNCTRINIPAYPGQAAAPSGQPAGAPSFLSDLPVNVDALMA